MALTCSVKQMLPFERCAQDSEKEKSQSGLTHSSAMGHHIYVKVVLVMEVFSGPGQQWTNSEENA